MKVIKSRFIKYGLILSLLTATAQAIKGDIQAFFSPNAGC